MSGWLERCGADLLARSLEMPHLAPATRRSLAAVDFYIAKTAPWMFGVLFVMSILKLCRALSTQHWMWWMWFECARGVRSMAPRLMAILGDAAMKSGLQPSVKIVVVWGTSGDFIVEFRSARSSAVSDLRHQIELRAGIPAVCQRLVQDDAVLDDHGVIDAGDANSVCLKLVFMPGFEIITSCATWVKGQGNQQVAIAELTNGWATAFGPEACSGKQSLCVRLGAVTDPGHMETDYWVGVLPITELPQAMSLDRSVVPFLAGSGVALSLSASELASGQWMVPQRGSRQARAFGKGSVRVEAGSIVDLELDLDRQCVTCRVDSRQSVEVPIDIQRPARLGVSMFCSKVGDRDDLRSVTWQGPQSVPY